MSDIYKLIDKALKIEDLKKAGGDAKFSSDTKEAYVRGLTNRLAKEMGVDNPEMLFDMCGKSTTIYAKIVLSVFRRGRDLHKFYAEGRVQTGEEAIKSVENA
ncbi:hypothetical protein FV242_33880 [Methylobacterium sp. WL64]|nr:hypothetical protein FV242_33880 [Methylobacterium sp. WL64]